MYYTTERKLRKKSTVCFYIIFSEEKWNVKRSNRKIGALCAFLEQTILVTIKGGTENDSNAK